MWNKNRPVQPTPAKHLTDEELKQQYGIHMTSRIQEDGAGGSEAKWADIDDDEDDWAPETIEWTDGTKVTLTHTDPVPPPEHHQEEPAQPPPVEAAAAGAAAAAVAKEPTRIAAPKPTTSIGPNPTVLRLGANAERQAKAASISSKGTNDRVPSGSTSPAPPPAKSPWASLPPVERVSPVNPSAHAPPPSRPPPHHYPPRDDVRHAHLPPQEIAADDFNRQWRESAPGAPRELFNSRSGRYEPVAENRRPSWRNEPASGGPRGPAVLQRPGQDHGGPAEPSAAFQTHRSCHHQEGMGWNRRRTSSNVSGGSGGFGRRMSFTRPDGPPRHFEARRGSQTNGMVDPALIDREQMHHHAPPHQHAPPVFASPSSTAAELAPTEKPQVSSNAPTAPGEDPLAMQARVMKETIRLAKQRREEEEEKERLARQERIRQKLASLGPAPEKPQRKENVEARKSQATPQPAATSPGTMHSPPKPPVPEPDGGPKQYGMMRVHHPDSVKKLVAANERDRASEKSTEKPPSAHSRHATSPRETKREPSQALEQPQPPQKPQQQQKPAQSPPQDANAEEQGGQWRGNLNAPGPYPSWSANNKLPSTSPSLKNPWKPLSSDRTLGNGIFDQALGGFPSRDLPLRSQLALDQPAIPPPTLPGSQDVSAIASLPSPDTRIAGYDPLSPIGRPGPIGPPSLQNPQWQQEPRNPGGLGAWGNFHAVAAQREAEESEQKRQEFNANRAQPNAVNNAVNFNETWKQVRTGDEGTQRHIMGGGVNQNNKNLPSNPLTGLDAPADGLPFSESHARPLGSAPTRSSRFFPHGPEQQKRAVVEKTDYERSPSPPPPEESSHPVFFGGSGRPLVHLPNPKPVVKLPPKAIAAPAPPPTFASMAAAPPRGAPAPSSTISWQERINDLFGKKTPPAKKSSLAVTSATKEPLEVQLPPTAAVSVSVSFPSKGVVSARGGGDGDLAVRQVEEQDEIFEDREPGSQPPVRVPNMAPAAAWAAAQPPSQSRQRGKIMKPVQSRSVEPYIVGLGEKDSYGNLRVLIRFPGAVASKICSLPKKVSSSRHRTSPNLKSRKGPKPREASGSGALSKKSSQQTGRSSSSRHPSQKASWGPRTATASESR